MDLHLANQQLHHYHHHHQSNLDCRRCRSRMANGIDLFGHRYRHLRRICRPLNHRNLRQRLHRCHDQMVVDLHGKSFQLVVL